MRLTHLGHSCLLVETEGARLLIDPGSFSDVDGVTGLDGVLVTHQHADHLDVARIGSLMAASPGARLLLDPDTASTVEGLPAHTVVGPGDRLAFGGTTVDVTGGVHAIVYGDFPGCANLAYLIDGGALLHPGDSFFIPPCDVDVLAVAVNGPWLKVAEAIDFVGAVSPRVAIPVHEAGAANPALHQGLLDTFCADGVVRRLEPGVEEQL